ncbi:hypothetical protein CTheo_7937 [Ceratobasidium theobromae]|uniref:Transmembrane protein n=1 Tax=Ceratobasidium theobromae TaxID=1582974 RepID=A0A5N5QAU1_9AGAM|nr:hypothetical protein CTheo_7937 [Ceratobasidium theobromae]
MFYNALVLVYMLLAAFPCIGQEERAAVEMLFELALTFNVELGQIVLTREQYEQAQEFLQQFLILSARHNLNIFVILQTIVYPLMSNLSVGIVFILYEVPFSSTFQHVDRMEVYATEQEARQLLNLSLNRLQAAVDAWVCENSELAFLKSVTPALVDQHTHNLMAREHGDTWWNTTCQSNSRSSQDPTQSTPLTESNLRRHRMLQRPQLLTNFMNASPNYANLESPTSALSPFSPSSAAGRPPTQRTTGSRPGEMPTWTRRFGVYSSPEVFSNSIPSFGPGTPQDASPRESWGYQYSSDRRDDYMSPWGDAVSDDQPADDDDQISVDVFERTNIKSRKAKKATLGRKLVRRLKAALSAIHL